MESIHYYLLELDVYSKLKQYQLIEAWYCITTPLNKLWRFSEKPKRG